MMIFIILLHFYYSLYATIEQTFYHRNVYFVKSTERTYQILASTIFQLDIDAIKFSLNL